VGAKEFEVRRVGFRFGTDAELAAMHLVEMEIEAERWPGRLPQPLESYLAYARSLPSVFDDHTWLAQDGDGTPIGCSACWSNSAGDPAGMMSYVYVRPAWRGRRVGWRLAEPVLDVAEAEGRSRLTWTTFDAVPAGDAFSRRLGGQVARVNRTSELRLTDLDWDLVGSWIEEGRRRATGYSLDFQTGPLSGDLLKDTVSFHHLMQTAPQDGLEATSILLDSTQVAEIDRHVTESGMERWLIFVRDPDGRCVGGTELLLDPWQPTVARQQNTGIDPAHRGLGLAKWAKAAMLERVRADRPGIERVRTANAFSNGPMLAINDALGFTIVEVQTDWQGEVAWLRAAVPWPNQSRCS
jgi:mycothiol synthase